MSIYFSGNGITLNYDANPMKITGPPTLRVRAISVFGLTGVGHLYGGLAEKQIECDRMMLDGFASKGAVSGQIDTMNGWIGDVGDVIEALGGATTTYQDCTFLGVTPLDIIRLDGSGQNGYYCPIRLSFTGRTP